MTALTNFQGSYAGLVWGPGTEIQLISIKGLRSLPAIQSSDSNRMRAPGVFSGWDVPGGRTITFTLLIVAQADLETQISNLEAAFVPLANSVGELDVQLPNWSAQRCVFGRTRGREILVDNHYQFGYVQATVEVFCPDPRIYSTPPTSTFIASGGSVPLNNVGNFESRPYFTLTATSATSTIVNAGDSGNQIVLADSPIGGLVAAGTLTVDILNRTVTDAAGKNRYDLITSATTWFALQPARVNGSGINTISITNGSGTFTWCSAWI